MISMYFHNPERALYSATDLLGSHSNQRKTVRQIAQLKPAHLSPLLCPLTASDTVRISRRRPALCVTLSADYLTQLQFFFPTVSGFKIS